MFIAIEAKIFLDTTPFESTETSRYYLNGVHVDVDHERKLANVVATDGAVLGLHQVSSDLFFEPFDDSCIISLSKEFKTTVKNKLKVNDKSSAKLETYIVIDGDIRGNQATIVAAYRKDIENESIDHMKTFFTNILSKGAKSKHWQGAEGDVLVDGNFPDYRRVIPDIDKATGANFAIDFNCLKRFSHLSDDTKSCPLTLMGTDANSPIIVVTNVKNFTGVIMPMRTGHDTRITP